VDDQGVLLVFVVVFVVVVVVVVVEKATAVMIVVRPMNEWLLGRSLLASKSGSGEGYI
jgi:hypothetical protein